MLLIVCAAAQSAWPLWLRLWGQAPDLVLAGVLSIGLLTGPSSGLTAGFMGAFLWASVSSSSLGSFFVSHMSLGFVAGALRGRMFSDRVPLAAMVAGIAVLLSSLVRLVLDPPPSPQSWIVAVLAQALYTALLIAPIYLLMRTLSRCYPEPEDF